MDQHLAYIEKIVARGGPLPREYDAFGRWIDEVADELRSGRLRKSDLNTLREAFGRALSPDTLQGFSLQKPHGYTGDYEIIDRMYRNHVTDDPALQNWDRYFQAQGAPEAVRNRKVYFTTLLKRLEHLNENARPRPVLNVASGPMRDVFEFFRSNGHVPNVQIACVDSDPDAIAYAKDLCAPYLDHLAFHRTNALRFTTDERYRLIWSAGLFDYLGDKGFKFLLRQLLRLLADEGELVIGNFSEENPTRNYMEIIGDWHLYHRSAEELAALARACGVAEEDLRIGRETRGINLFLHIKKGAHFIPIDRGTVAA